MTDEPAPTIRRVLTLALTILLLLTTVPAISLAPDIPEVAPSADAQVNCPVIGAGSAAANVSVNLTGTQTHDCPDPCNYTDCSPSTDPCDYIDCGTDPCNIVNCPEIWCVDKPCPSTNPCDHLGITPCPPSTNPCDYPVGQECPPDPNVVDLTDEIRIDVTEPNQTFTGDEVSISGGVQNNLDVPVVLRLELTPRTDQVCSVVRYSTSGENNVREHEYLLWPNGTDEQLKVPGSDQGLINGDTISFSATIAGKEPGRCSIDVQAIVHVRGRNSVAIGSETPSFPVLEPPPEADLGDMVVHTGTCTGHSVSGKSPTTEPVPVEAGDAKVFAKLDYAEKCATLTDNAWLRVQRKKNGEWVNVTGAHLGSTDTAEAATEVHLDEGTHTFRVQAVLLEGWFEWDCFASVAVLAAALLSPEPSSTTVAAGVVVGTALSAGLAVAACEDSSMLAQDSYKVQVEAVSGPAEMVDVLVNGVSSGTGAT